MDQETRLLINGFTMFKKDLKVIFHKTLPNPKDPKASEEIGKEGNALFSKNSHSDELHGEILGRYNESAALAPSCSQELASAYANRSAFLLHIDKYEECIRDIEKALKITEFNEMKVELLCRKVECLKNLGTTYENILDEAQSLVDNIDDDENKQILNEMVTKVAKLSVAKKGHTNQNTNESVNLPVTDNVLEKVSIKHNEKYGRHLVAEQNYKPGNVIVVEKLFSSSVKPPNRYTNCHHCLKTCWSGIPCNHCDWAIFCSEDCSQIAWIEYHDIECSLGSLLNTELDIPWSFCSMSIKILIKALKEAGSVQNLRAKLEAVDQCKDLCSKGFYKDGKFMNNTIESFYSLTKWKLSRFEQIATPRIALITLIGLLKQPRLVNIFSVKKMKDLIQNQDIVYLGSLLIRFTAIRFNNSFSFVHFLSIDDAGCGVPEAPRGSCLTLLVSLVNNSCCPNANVCFTEDGKVILYAVQSVKKNSQIFISYSKEYYAKPLKDRETDLISYNFKCDCQACIESWPAVLLIPIMEGESNYVSMLKFLEAETEFMRQCRDVIEAMVKVDYSKATLDKLVEKIILAFKCLKQPSIFTSIMLDALNSCFTNVYNGLKPQLFGKCTKCE